MANQAWQITTAGTIGLRDLGPIPKPGSKQVLVRIHAVSLNYRDRVVIDHSPSYPVVAKENLIPGSDGAGVVEEPGPDSVWMKGDRVILQPNQWTSGYDERDFEIDKVLGGGDVDGSFRRWIVLNDNNLFKAPDTLTFEEACTVHTAGVTAFRSIFYGGVKVGPGTTVLTQGTGGVSCYAIMVTSSIVLNRV